MWGEMPVCILTDQDPTMKKAIADIFLFTNIVLGTWERMLSSTWYFMEERRVQQRILKVGTRKWNN